MPSQAEERAKFLVKKMNHLGDTGAANTVSMGTTDVTVNSLTSEGATVSQGTLRAKELFHDVGTAGAAPTALTATELSVNTHYKNTTATTLAMTIPSAAASNIGDWITVVYSAALNNTVDHTYTTTTDAAFAPGSGIIRVGGAVTSAYDEATTDDNIITLTGATNGDGGPGTMLKFVNLTGTTNGWAVQVIVLNRGNGSAASASAFS